MSGFSATIARLPGVFDDRMNPIVVKEIRQAVRSKLVASVLVLFLVVELVVLAIFLFSAEGGDYQMGPTAFMSLQGVLLATLLFFVPLYVGVRLAAERSDASADLLFITTIRPSSIVWGKWLAGCLVAVMIASACAPFMVITYLLRGIDLPSIAIVLCMDALAMLVAVLIAVMLACVPGTRASKALMGLVLLGVLISGFSMMMAMSGMLIFEGVGSMATGSDFWVGVAGILAGTFAVLGLMFVLTLAMLKPASSNRALPVRLYLMFAWLGTGLVLVGIDYWYSHFEITLVWGGLWVMLLQFALVAGASERDEWGPRMRRSIPRNPLLRPLALLHYSGAAGGIVWACLMLALTGFVVYLTSLWLGRGWSDRDVEAMLTFLGISSLYVLAYVLLGAMVRRGFGARVQSAATGAFTFLLIAIGCVVPPIVMFLVSPRGWDRQEEIWLLGNPWGILDNETNGVLSFRMWLIGSLAAAVMLLVSLPWLVSQVRRFRPLDAPTGAEQTMAEPPPPEPPNASVAVAP